MEVRILSISHMLLFPLFTNEKIEVHTPYIPRFIHTSVTLHSLRKISVFSTITLQGPVLTNPKFHWLPVVEMKN